VGRADVTDWRPEDPVFWESTGKKIANRQLWISWPSLLPGFSVWLMWGIITVQMLNLGFPFTQPQLFALTAIAGISGATLRIPASFFVRMAGGRNAVFFTTALLLIPAVGTGFALMDKNTPLWVFQLLALLSGIGGGNFATSMSNISTWFPKSQQGLALGINAGLANGGVTVMQVVIPLAMTTAMFGALGGDPMTLLKPSGTLIGRIEAGTPTYIQNAGFVWVLIVAPMAVLCWFGLKNLTPISPNIGSTAGAFGKILLLYAIGLIVTAIFLYLYLPAPTGLGWLNMWVALPLIVVATLAAMRLVAFGEMKASLQRQFAIFKDKHTWSMTALYIVTFGSFIGFSAALPLSITVIFGFTSVEADGVIKRVAYENAPSALTWAWIGPFVGAFIRPVGGWLSDRTGGAILTQIISAVMVVCSVAVGYVMLLAYQSPTPDQYFAPFMILFVLIFAAAGIGNASTFRTIGVVFSREQAGPVLGWTSAIGAYGAFIAPIVMGAQIRAGTPQYAMYGFAAFYAVCLVLNWWFYLRRNAYVKNP
jgi:NNP family nitrate/nitrite transporter-like MFS transporter